MIERDEETIHNRLNNPHKSKASRIGWKRHRASYNAANRKKERDNMSKSFYNIAKEIEECLSIDEAEVAKDNVFELDCTISFNNIAGGVGFKIDKDTNNVSVSTSLDEDTGRGAYRLDNQSIDQQSLDVLYNELKDELKTLADQFDNDIQLLLAKHGLKET